MRDAIWLFAALPEWYVEAAADPFGSGALTLIPAIGLLSLVVGIIIGAIKRRRELLWFLLPFALSEVFVAVAGALRGQLTGDASAPPLLVFFVAQVAVSAYLAYRIKGARAAAAALGLFSVSFAAAAVFVAAMSFNDSWL